MEGGRFVESVAAVRSGLGSFFRLKDTKQNLLQHLAPQQQQHGAMSPISRQGFKGRQEHQPNKVQPNPFHVVVHMLKLLVILLLLLRLY